MQRTWNLKNGEVYVSSEHIKNYSTKPLDARHFVYKEIKSKYAHKSALHYITWGLNWDIKNRKRRTIRKFLKMKKEVYKGLEKVKL